MEPEIVFGRWSKDMDGDEGTWYPETDGPTEGWGARLSAPGYLDATDWGVYNSRAEARENLAWLHDLCPECLAEDCDCDNAIGAMKRSLDHG